MSQLTLPIQLRDEFTFANFFAGKNQNVVAYLQTICAQQNQEKYCYLWGQTSSGRSHLLQALCLTAHQNNLTAIYLSLSSIIELNPALLENLEFNNIVCLDDIEKTAGNKIWEEAIFHFYNRCQISNCSLIISGDKPASELTIQLPDLLSRLNSGISLQLKPLDDAEKIAALQLKAQYRGFELPTETANYVLLHLPRDLNNLFLFLDKLDQSSLVEQRKLTIPFVKKVLGI